MERLPKNFGCELRNITTELPIYSIQEIKCLLEPMSDVSDSTIIGLNQLMKYVNRSNIEIFNDGSIARSMHKILIHSNFILCEKCLKLYKLLAKFFYENRDLNFTDVFEAEIVKEFVNILLRNPDEKTLEDITEDITENIMKDEENDTTMKVFPATMEYPKNCDTAPEADSDTPIEDIPEVSFRRKNTRTIICRRNSGKSKLTALRILLILKDLAGLETLCELLEIDLMVAFEMARYDLYDYYFLTVDPQDAEAFFKGICKICIKLMDDPTLTEAASSILHSTIAFPESVLSEVLISKNKCPSTLVTFLNQINEEKMKKFELRKCYFLSDSQKCTTKSVTNIILDDISYRNLTNSFICQIHSFLYIIERLSAKKETAATKIHEYAELMINLIQIFGVKELNNSLKVQTAGFTIDEDMVFSAVRFFQNAIFHEINEVAGSAITPLIEMSTSLFKSDKLRKPVAEFVMNLSASNEPSFISTAIDFLLELLPLGYDGVISEILQVAAVNIINQPLNRSSGEYFPIFAQNPILVAAVRDCLENNGERQKNALIAFSNLFDYFCSHSERSEDAMGIITNDESVEILEMIDTPEVVADFAAELVERINAFIEGAE